MCHKLSSHAKMKSLEDWLVNQNERAYEIQRILTSCPALGPENGGQGEMAKALLVEGFLQACQLPYERLDRPDDRVESGFRPNIVARKSGKCKTTLWLFGHLDIVPSGDPSAWKSNPFSARREGDLIFGRGVEDNQQAIVSMLLLAEGLNFLNIVPELSLGLVFMADEECGSKYGLKWILEKYGGLFSPDDLFIIPDGGSSDATMVEIAEKAQLWLKFIITGRQCHASMPNAGRNALIAASHLVVALSNANEIFKVKDELFNPPYSTFVPTLHEKNVDAINILPGKDVFYMDCRLLPACDHKLVLEWIEGICIEIGKKLKVKVKVEVTHYQPSSSTSADAPVILELAKAVKSVYGVEIKPAGIGGATVAAFLRERNLPAVVWSCLQNSCHQPNEHSSLAATCKDAAVFANIIMRNQ